MIKIKVPIDKIGQVDTYNTIKKQLKSDPTNAYTRMGLMVTCYKVNPEALNKSFREWKPHSLTQMYTNIVKNLRKLVNEGLVQAKKEGKFYLYWWKA